MKSGIDRREFIRVSGATAAVAVTIKIEDRKDG
ncbi:MAG: twin-arginine translocation signal domain-containing protein [Candidatus Rokubacteria bacterium]|nr:twin-arginine translocation signal domain-containing protein [Candidatus Rokubacteria bacterium]MBI3824543.1 twin-arginine translocation signal domain-containing protein [Candidatus Rokubacteria bacterium]